MNRYLTKIAMRSETKQELKDTAVIGAMGVGTSALTQKALQALPSTHPLPYIPGKGFRQILRSGGNLLRSPVAKAGLIGGALGIAGDYAAVKLNKARHQGE